MVEWFMSPAEVTVAVRVRPRASRAAVGGSHGGTYGPAILVAVREPAVDGRATQAALDALLRREAAKRLGLPVDLVLFNSAGAVVEAVKAREVDLAFVAIDPVRATDMDYTAPYVIIEGAYLVATPAVNRPWATNCRWNVAASTASPSDSAGRARKSLEKSRSKSMSSLAIA